MSENIKSARDIVARASDANFDDSSELLESEETRAKLAELKRQLAEEAKDEEE